MNTFWREFADFKNKRGVFARDYIWAVPGIDTRPDMWHHYYSYTETEVLGKLACCLVLVPVNVPGVITSIKRMGSGST